MMLRLLIPTGRWKIDVDLANEHSSIRLCGRAFRNVWRVEQQVETVLLTQDQAQELVSSLNMALLELELQRTAALARAAEGAGCPP
ncbi:hypothetical protein [Paraburkholderia sp. DGU8]|jgi:hypothetical protein|uniref:hypothetical protein n=1 Tax=Paraburkholderia sp. DGU8 TaxID=3161997 RepID=UPI003466528F